MEFTFNIVGPKEKVDELVNKVREMTGEKVISDQFPADRFKKDINVTTSKSEAADFIDEYCEDNNMTCELI